MEKLEVLGDNPKPRFGHTMNQISINKAILFAGAIGDSSQYSITNDLYSLDLVKFIWKKLNPSGKKPSVRAAHASCSIELNQVMIYGGATGGGGLSSDELFLLDLKKGEDKAEWISMTVNGITPGARYGLSLIFLKPNIYVFGGNSGNKSLNDVWIMNLDKSPFSWTQMDLSTSLESPIGRVYHSAALCSSGSANGMIIIYGGRGNDQNPLNDTWGFRKHRDGRWDWIKAPYKNTDKIVPKSRYQHSIIFSGSLMMVIGGRTNLAGQTAALEIFDTDTSNWYQFLNIPKFRHSGLLYESRLYLYGGFESETPNIPTNEFLYLELGEIFDTNLIKMSGFSHILNEDMHQNKNSNQMNKVLTDIGPAEESPPKKDIRMGPLAVVGTKYGPNDNVNDTVKRIPIHHLQDESKKMIGTPNYNNNNISLQISSSEEIAQSFLNLLLTPNMKTFKMNKEMIFKLCEETQIMLQKQPLIINIARAPIKIFGNLHGQFEDLLKIFEHFGSPDDTLQGDIESNDYLFLGDYVDRGTKSIEVICLLFALKVKYPEQIHLLRGHHEDRTVNFLMGFAEECAEKLTEDPQNPNSIYQKINKVFEFLPLAAVIENKIFCVHGGIGQTLKSLRQIEKLQRPIEIIHDSSLNLSNEQILINELLWTDPVSNDNNEKSNRGLFGNEELRCCKFSLERTKSFLNNNNLTMMIRSHEFVKDGYENMDHKIITIVSCFDYCGQHKNAGGILIVKKNFEIIPKMIIPAVNSVVLGIKWNGLNNKVGISYSAKEKKIRKFVSPLRKNQNN